MALFEGLLNKVFALWGNGVFSANIIDHGDGTGKTWQGVDGAGNVRIAGVGAGVTVPGTVRHATTPTRLDASTGALDVDAAGNAHVTATVAADQFVVLQGPEDTALDAAEIASLALLDTLSCDGVEANADGVYLFAQLREAARLAPITAAEWTAGEGWSFEGTIATHDGTGGHVADLETVDVVKLGVPYAIVYTISGMSAGTLTEKLGTAGALARAADGTYMQIKIPTVDGQVHFTPTADFDGSIDIADVWVVPFHELPSAGVQKPLACSKIVACAMKSAPETKVIAPATVAIRALHYRRQGAVQS